MFVESFAVPWPCGYGAEPSVVERFGAYQPHHPGNRLRPTIYLADAAGRVLWHDGQARPRHLRDARAILADLTAAIERALAEE
jgi:hypothetical protein